MNSPTTFLSIFILTLSLLPNTTTAQSKKKDKKPPAPPHTWVSPGSPDRIKNQKLPSSLSHASFKSPSMGIDVGYFIYLPPQYEAEPETRFPVVFHLHGGRPGSESKSINLTKWIHPAIESGDVHPMIYVFPNGGPLSWYDHAAAGEHGQGESIFVKELLPHIDQTYRTTGERALEGFSQGGRGTTRIMLKHPQLWTSAAPGGSGYEPEQRIQRNGGKESDHLQILPLGYNCWDLLDSYATKSNRPPLPILFWVGTKGFNYQFNLKYMKLMEEHDLPYEKIVVPDVGHSASNIYAQQGPDLMKFHARHFTK